MSIEKFLSSIVVDGTISKVGGTALQYLMADGSITTGQVGNNWTLTGTDIKNNNIGNVQLQLQPSKQVQILNSGGTQVGFIDENGTYRAGTATQYVTVGLLGGNTWMSMVRLQSSMGIVLGNPQVSQAFTTTSTNYFGSSYIAGSDEVSAVANAEHSFNIGNSVGDGITSGIFRIGRTRLQSTVPIKYATDLSGSYDSRSLVDKAYVDSKTGSTNLTYISSSTNGTVVSDTGTDATIPLVDSTSAGLMSPSDRQLLYNDSSTGIISFGGLSINTDTTKFNVGAIKAWFVNNYTDPLNPTKQYKSFPATTANVVPNIGTQSVSYVAIDINGTLQFSSSPFDQGLQRDYCILGVIVHSNRVIINAINNQPVVAIDAVAQLSDLMEGIGFFNISGNVISPNGLNLNINKSYGHVFKQGSNFLNSNKDPHTLVTPALVAPPTIRYRLQNGTEYTNTAVIDPGYYDNAGVRTIVPGTKYSIQRIYLFQSNLIRIQYGQAVYSNMADAIQAITTEPFTVEQNILENGLFRGLLIIRDNTTDLTDTTKALFIEAGKFGNISGLGSLSTTSLQQAYNNSTVPLITTNSTLDGFSIKNGTGGLDNITANYKSLSAAGVTTFQVNADGATTALSFIKTGGTATQFLKANGSVDSTAYTTNLGTVTSIGMTVPTGLTITGSPITTSGTLALSLTAGYSIPTTANQTNWNTAFTQTLQWNGGSTNLVSATGRASLGATTVGSNMFTSTNPTAITFLRANANNTVSWLDAATFRTAIGAGTSTVSPAALTRVNDTNVTITLGGTPATALLQATSVTVGWTGTLADARITSAANWNSKQAGSTNLTSLSGLTYVSTSFVKMTAAGTFALDTNTYLPLSGGTLTGNLNGPSAVFGTDLTKGTTINSSGIDFNNRQGTVVSYPSSQKGFNWQISSDGAWMKAYEMGSDMLEYEFGMRDNYKSGDRYIWKLNSWTGVYDGIEALSLHPQASFNNNQPFYQNGRFQLNKPRLATQLLSDTNTALNAQNVSYIRNNSTFHNPSLGASTLSLTANPLGFTNTIAVGYLIKIRDAVSNPNTFCWANNAVSGLDVNLNTGWIGVDIPCSTSPITLNNGVTITFNSTTGGVAGESIGFKVLPQGNVVNTDGTATLPSYTFIDDTNTGMYRVGAETIGFTTNGVHRVSINTGGLVVTGSTTSTSFIGPLTGNASTATNVAWSGITSKPTTLSGYGITDTPWTAYLPLTGGIITNSLGINGSPSLYGSIFHVKGITGISPQNSVMISTNVFTQGAGGNGSTIRIGHGATSGDTYGSIDNLIGGGLSYGNLVLQRGGGFIGLGIETPTEKLHVVGKGLFTDIITSTGLNLTLETASTLASFDASKNLKSLSTTTYPNLTELSYVKGTTSSIQTQIDNRQLIGSSDINNIIVCDGDSRTAGFTGTVEYKYSDNLGLGAGYTIYNTATGGATITDNEASSVRWITKDAFNVVSNKYSKLATNNIVVIWAGYNDMSVRDKSAEITFESIKSYCLSRKKEGWKVIIVTEPNHNNTTGETRRLALNTLIRTKAYNFADAIADVGDNEYLGMPGAYLNTTFFYDGVHMTAAGYAQVAALVNNKIIELVSSNKKSYSKESVFIGDLANGTIGTEPIISLERPLKNVTSFPNYASFNLGRYSGIGGSFDPFTQLDIKLKSTTNGDKVADKTVLSLYDNGNILVPNGNITASAFIGPLTGNASTATNVAWSGITSKPTTLSGYGITDSLFKTNGGYVDFNVNNLLTEGQYNWVNTSTNSPSAGTFGTLINFVSQGNTHDNSSNWLTQLGSATNNVLYIRQKVNSGAFTSWRTIWDSSTLTNLNQLTTRNFSDLQNKPTTLSGYGITDGVTGTGATNTLTKFTGTNTIGVSSITDTGSLVTITNPLTTGIVSTPYINVGDNLGNGFRMNYLTGTFTQPWTAIPSTQNASLQVASGNGGMLFRSLTNANANGIIFQSFIGTNGAVTNPPIKFQAFKSNGTTGIVDLLATDIAVQYANLSAPLTTMLGNGNWGFGNIAPSEKVHVTGNVLATGYKIPSGAATQFLKANGTTDSTTYAPIASPALTGTPTAPTATVGTNTTQVATTAFVQANAVRPYLVYTALVSQTGTDAPTAIVLENTLGGTVTWSRIGNGTYRATLTGAFTLDKTTALFTGNGSTVLAAYRGSNDIISVNTGTADGLITKATLEIRVYP